MNSFGPLVVLIVAALGLLVPSAGIAQEPQNNADELASVPRISIEDFKQLLAGAKVLVLDVRDAEAYKSGHIPGALSLPPDDIGKHATELASENRPIVTYCAWPSEHTSARAALEMKKLGIKDVRALKGGIRQWESQGNPIVKGDAPR